MSSFHVPRVQVQKLVDGFSRSAVARADAEVLARVTLDGAMQTAEGCVALPACSLLGMTDISPLNSPTSETRDRTPPSLWCGVHMCMESCGWRVGPFIKHLVYQSSSSRLAITSSV